MVRRVWRDEGGAWERRRRGRWRWRSQVGDIDDEEKFCRARVKFVAFAAECGDSGDKFGRSSCYSVIHRTIVGGLILPLTMTSR